MVSKTNDKVNDLGLRTNDFEFEATVPEQVGEHELCVFASFMDYPYFSEELQRIQVTVKSQADLNLRRASNKKPQWLDADFRNMESIVPLKNKGKLQLNFGCTDPDE